jgi:hypothetical protein
MFMTAVLTTIALCALSAGLAQAQVKLPDGDGKAVVEKVCTACHDLDTALADKHTEKEWRSVVDTMVNRGAEGIDEEFDKIVKYLAKFFGKDTASLNPSHSGNAARILTVRSNASSACKIFNRKS